MNQARRRLFTIVPLLCAACGGRETARDAAPEATALDRYVAKEDSSYQWTLVRSIPGDGFTTHVIDMASQSWRSSEEVDRPLWRHWLTIARPDTVESPVALLLIGGGRNGGDPPEGMHQRMSAIAVRTRAVVAELRMVPNQPLTFRDDGRPRWEDDLIAYTWNKYMDTGDEEWPARLPMVKSAVRAMDTVEAFSKSETGGRFPVDRFVVAGGSKRGWTTWLTGAVDDRVVAIVPIVIDVLNVRRSMEHHYAAYGFWAPAIGDYERNGITERRDDPRYLQLLELVDPYHYRHRLEKPKFIINSAGDEFFLPDSSRFYFDDLIGEKHLRYVPNTDHGVFDGSDAADSLEAFFQAVIRGDPRPVVSWSFEGDGSIRVRSESRPLEARLWKASNPEARDFRLLSIGKAWTSAVLEPVAREGDAAVYVAREAPPERGWTAFFVELEFAGSGACPLKVTTAVRVVPDTLPHEEELNRLTSSASR